MTISTLLTLPNITYVMGTLTFSFYSLQSGKVKQRLRLHRNFKIYSKKRSTKTFTSPFDKNIQIRLQEQTKRFKIINYMKK